MNKMEINIVHNTDPYFAMQKAKNTALLIGFDESESDLVAIIVSELAQNIYKHATKGVIILTPILDDAKKGIEIVSEDNGPGIKDISQAFVEGFSTQNTLGLGLSGIKRLSDEFLFDNHRNKGTKITSRKWLKKKNSIKLDTDFYIFIQPLLSPIECGDTGLILEFDNILFVALIDVIGHGHDSYQVANKATTYLKNNFQDALSRLKIT